MREEKTKKWKIGPQNDRSGRARVIKLLGSDRHETSIRVKARWKIGELLLGQYNARLLVLLDFIREGFFVSGRHEGGTKKLDGLSGRDRWRQNNHLKEFLTQRTE